MESWKKILINQFTCYYLETKYELIHTSMHLSSKHYSCKGIRLKIKLCLQVLVQILRLEHFMLNKRSEMVLTTLNKAVTELIQQILIPSIYEQHDGCF